MRTTDLCGREGHRPFRKFLPPLGNPLTPGDHTRGDIDRLQVKPFVEEFNQSLRA